MSEKEIHGFSNKEIKMLCDEYMKNNFIDPAVSEQFGVKRGLRNPDGTGVLAGLTNICDVQGYRKDEAGNKIPCAGKLIYRGYDLDDIINQAIREDRFMFEEVVWLLLFGKMPTEEQLAKFREIIEERRELPDGFPENMILEAPSPNIMNKMARSVLAMYSYDDNPDDTRLENLMRQSINLIAQMPTMMIYAYQAYKRAYKHESLIIHFPIKGLFTAEHILSTYRADQSYTHEEARLLDLCLIIHADHGGGNNSTFTNRVLSSTGTDTYSAISSSICSLKGPLHGGANLKVIQMLDEMLENIDDIYDEEEVTDYLRRILRKEAGDGSGLIYGIGHAVYTVSDPRAQLLKKHMRPMAYKKGLYQQFDLLCNIEKLAPAAIRLEKGKVKNVCANMDLFSGLVYRILDIDEHLFTPIFAIARCAGWCAHRMEEIEFSKKIMRPAYKYIGD